MLERENDAEQFLFAGVIALLGAIELLRDVPDWE
jgi:hypothetical protein